jgi:hypothetical protein
MSIYGRPIIRSPNLGVGCKHDCGESMLFKNRSNRFESAVVTIIECQKNAPLPRCPIFQALKILIKRERPITAGTKVSHLAFKTLYRDEKSRFSFIRQPRHLAHEVIKQDRRRGRRKTRILVKMSAFEAALFGLGIFD